MKSLYKQTYQVLVNWLVSKRLLAGMTQQQLSEKLLKPQSYVSKYENLDRRLDFIETIEICIALKADPNEIIKTTLDAYQ